MVLVLHPLASSYQYLKNHIPSSNQYLIEEYSFCKLSPASPPMFEIGLKSPTCSTKAEQRHRPAHVFDSGLYVNILRVPKYKSKHMENRLGECKENSDTFTRVTMANLQLIKTCFFFEN